ncbi:MAG: NBR1-Ig-like domain-containing protein [Anaerolineales bacterium]|nr:NBR1-Ig-like domain-containing protein [Anaerolineales bacterium]
MTKNIFLTFLLSMLLTSCITVSVQTATPSAPQFVTATLPPTKEVTPHPTRTPRPAPSTGTAAAVTKPVKCKDGAVLLEDVTIPDNSKVPAGKIFTKTWKFKNTGTCAWTGFTINYVTGERMNAPASAPVPETAAGATVDISIDLTAPATDGAYATFFSLHNAAGESIAIGAEKTFYVKVIVSAGGASVPTQSLSTSSGTPVVSIGNINCKYSYSESPAYVQELASLINRARRNAGLPALSLNPLLTQAAQGHSIDMACNNFLGHEGSDGSSIGSLVREVGYVGFIEIIAIGTPQNAMDQWAADSGHWESVLDAGVTQMGIGYAYNAHSDYGSYFTVDMGR